jgi:hypothetical protein
MNGRIIRFITTFASVPLDSGIFWAITDSGFVFVLSAALKLPPHQTGTRLCQPRAPSPSERRNLYDFRSREKYGDCCILGTRIL